MKAKLLHNNLVLPVFVLFIGAMAVQILHGVLFFGYLQVDGEVRLANLIIFLICLVITSKASLYLWRIDKLYNSQKKK